jgi:hypothetical protein
VSCQKLLENAAFTSLMQRILKTLERVYGTPVDIEYAVNMDKDGEFVVNLLQCRPLYLGGEGEEVHVENLSLQKVLFDVRGSSMGSSKKRKIDVVVQIDAKLYHEMPYAQKYKAANAVGRINRYYADTGRNLLLMTPGRIGTSSPELGVPVSFADISCFGVICEVSDSQAGFMPELSYGSHMFQDMVEAEMSYSAVFNDHKTIRYDPSVLQDVEDRFAQICPDMEELSGMISVREPENLYYWLDSVGNHAVCGSV